MQAAQNARGRGPRPAWKAFRGQRRAFRPEIPPNGFDGGELLAQLGERQPDFSLGEGPQGFLDGDGSGGWRLQMTFHKKN
jgi:hypothetical protein